MMAKSEVKHTFGLRMAAVSGAHALVLVLWRGTANKNGVVGMGLDMLLQILGTLKGLAAEIALVRLERDMNADVRSDVIALDGSSAATCPLARQVEVVGALPANMTLTDVILNRS
jgi:hypothetical protein